MYLFSTSVSEPAGLLPAKTGTASACEPILQPSTATSAPVVGVAIVSETPVAGSATGATGLASAEQAVRFAVETAKDFGRGTASFLDQAEFATLKSLYGSLSHLRSAGN